MPGGGGFGLETGTAVLFGGVIGATGNWIWLDLLSANALNDGLPAGSGTAEGTSLDDAAPAEGRPSPVVSSKTRGSASVSLANIVSPQLMLTQTASPVKPGLTVLMTCTARPGSLPTLTALTARIGPISAC